MARGAADGGVRLPDVANAVLGAGSSDGFNLAKWRAECAEELALCRRTVLAKRPKKSNHQSTRLEAIFAGPPPPSQQAQLGKSPSVNISLRMSEALFADPYGGICRDSLQLGPLLDNREVQMRSAAKVRRAQDSAVGRLNRKEASAWRVQRRQKGHGSDFQPSGGCYLSQCPPPLLDPSSPLARDATRVSRKQSLAALSDVSDPDGSVGSRCSAPRKSFADGRPPPQPRRSVARPSFSPRASMAPRVSVLGRQISASTPQIAQTAPPTESLSEVARRVRAKVRQGLKAALKVRRRRMAKLARRIALRKAQMQDIPDDEADAERDAFNMYADPARGALSIANASSCLAELGLRGKTRHERQAVDTAAARAAAKVQWETEHVKVSGLEAHHHKTANGEPPLLAQAQSSHEFSDELGAPPAIPGPGQAQHELFFEDFSTELIPAVRLVLTQLRQQPHFEHFEKVKASSPEANGNNTVLTAREFERAAHDMGIEANLVTETVRELYFRQADSQHKVTTNEGETVQLDFETAHDAIVLLEERSERLQRNREQQLRQEVNMEDDMFWQHRNELLQLQQTFCIFDADASGLLSYGEVKTAMKKIGLEPFSPGHADAVEETIRETDSDGNGQLDFCEFLHLIDVLRAQITDERRVKLKAAFRKHLHDPQGEPSLPLAPERDLVSLKDLEVVLIEAGVILHNRQDLDFVRRSYEEFEHESGGVNFSETQEIAQRMFERIFQLEQERNAQYAQSLGMDISKLAEHQWAFDQLDEDQTGTLSMEEVMQAVKTVVKRPPKETELQELAEQLGSESSNGELGFRQFLQLMHLCDSEAGMFGVGVPYTLDQVAEHGLMQILSLDETLSATYLNSLHSEDLMELVASLIGCDANTNLREWGKQPIANFLELFEYAKQCQRHRRRRAKQWDEEAEIEKESSVRTALNKLAGAIARGETSQQAPQAPRNNGAKSKATRFAPTAVATEAPRGRLAKKRNSEPQVARPAQPRTSPSRSKRLSTLSVASTKEAESGQ
mmetsp:Transcript_15117/g.34390  ORF Transcript_15117/g.34390 Transcript_15117/m.34390 type:complete len:1017 (+) Transcript_15117:125-3175(+)